ncbi:MAG: M13 family metallopeptidase [Bacteroidia bacterium]|nr:M13 family metallopeptidase [Bacteroidia bacterium]
MNLPRLSLLIITTVLSFVMVSCGESTTKQTLRGADISNVDTTVRATDDFYSYVNGLWLKSVEIPPSESSWGSFVELRYQNVEKLRALMEEAGISAAEKGSVKQKVGDFYKTGMDTAAIERAGVTPIQDLLDDVRNISDKNQIAETAAKIGLRGADGFFRTFVRNDLKKSNVYALYLYQGGLGMPNRDYYLTEGGRFDKYREEYLVYIQTLFSEAGGNPEAAGAIYDLEKQMAEISRKSVDLREAEKNYHKMPYAEAEALLSNFGLNAYLSVLKIPQQDSIIIGQPEFLEGLNKLMAEVSLETLKAYMEFTILRSSAPYLSNAFADADFRFNDATLRGVKEKEPRWKIVGQQTSGMIGMLVGQLYVEKHFSPEAKAKVNQMVNDLRDAFAQRIERLEWMSAETKTEALKKLKTMRQKLGYPDKWEDYTKLEINTDSYIGNVQRAREFEIRRRLDRIGKEVDREEWFMSPQIVNASYNPTNNEITFPAGILQPPFFDPNAVDAVNYGGIGTVIGHEITHGFDDNGSKFDSQGNLRNWWTSEDSLRFRELTQKIRQQYDAYTVLDTVHVNGQLTLGENIADHGGIAIAYEAMQLAFKRDGRPELVDGYTPEQQFFLNFAILWQGKYREDAQLQRIKTDPHSPGEYRAKGTLSNFRPFYEAFGVKEGDGMFRSEIVEIW